MNNTIFFSVDTQKDFINPDGALYVKDAELIKDKLKYLTAFADKHNIKVVSTIDSHTEKDKEISDKPDFINTFPRHCMIGSSGANFIEETAPLITKSYYVSDKVKMTFLKENVLKHRNIVLLKNKFDIFKGNKYTDKVLKTLKFKNVVIFGVTADICVNYAIYGLLKRKYNVYAVIDAMKASPSADIISIFSNWLNQGIKLITTEQIKDRDKKGLL